MAQAWKYTAGQPWLVNALASEIVDKMKVPRSEPVTVRHIEIAKERLIEARATHLDSLVARVYEPRVQRILEPMIAGNLPPSDTNFDDDLAYVRDLGLVATQPLQMANPIYQEIIIRVLGLRTEQVVTTRLKSFIQPDGRLDFVKLLLEFAEFWQEHGEILAARDAYHEAAPQLVIMAFFQRVADGGGTIDREYGVGRGRIDLLIRWFCQNGARRAEQQREAVELKVWRKGTRDPLHKGLSQLDDYLDRRGLALRRERQRTLTGRTTPAVDPDRGVPGMSVTPWRKSSRSGGSGGQRVEVRRNGDRIEVRDSKDPAGPVLSFPLTEWYASTADLPKPGV